MSVQQVADLTGKHSVDAMLDIAVADRLQTDVLRRPAAGVVGPAAARSCSTRTCCSACPTAAPTPSSSPPAATRPRRSPSRSARTSGSRYEEAHRRLSGLPAQLAGFHDRGLLRIDGPADVVVYDPESLEVGPNEVVEDLPGGEWRRIQKASGYHAVFVNGVRTIADDAQTDTASGPPAAPRSRLTRRAYVRRG